MKGTIKLKKRGNKNLRIAMIGHKVVPSRRGGIERVLTIMCPLMIKKGHQVTCFNRSGDKVENEYVKTVKRKKYRGVQLKKVITINKRGCCTFSCRRTKCISMDSETVWKALYRNDSWN